jgi:trans-aconitate methyltransferase
VVGLCEWWGLEVRRVLDVGAGPGYWRDWLQAQRPGVEYVGIDVSEHACRRWGHARADIAVWTPPAPCDLVVCQGVLQYLDDPACAAAIANLAAATSGVLYLEVPTVADRATVLDTAATDLDVHWRTGAWYRRRLGRWFRPAGAGLWVRSGSGVLLYELEGPSGAAARRG